MKPTKKQTKQTACWWWTVCCGKRWENAMSYCSLIFTAYGKNTLAGSTVARSNRNNPISTPPLLSSRLKLRIDFHWCMHSRHETYQNNLYQRTTSGSVCHCEGCCVIFATVELQKSSLMELYFVIAHFTIQTIIIHYHIAMTGMQWLTTKMNKVCYCLSLH
jgi:hypothetical protein